MERGGQGEEKNQATRLAAGVPNCRYNTGPLGKTDKEKFRSQAEEHRQQQKHGCMHSQLLLPRACQTCAWLFAVRAALFAVLLALSVFVPIGSENFFPAGPRRNTYWNAENFSAKRSCNGRRIVASYRRWVSRWDSTTSAGRRGWAGGHVSLRYAGCLPPDKAHSAPGSPWLRRRP